MVALNEALAASTWHHLGATYNAPTGEMRIYLNGGLKNIFMAPVAQVDDDALPLYFGADDSGTRWFNGRMDDLAIYNHVLPPYHMIALANGASPANLPPVPQPIITSVVRTGGVDPVGPAIMNSALAQNALAYADRVHVWDNFPAAFPELVGADYVRIANDDRDAANLRLNVALDRPSTLYLFRDSRLTGTVLANMNQWMTAYGFQSTGQSIWLDENGDGSANTEFYVFRGNFPAGSVDLFAQNTPGANAIYGIAAVEQMALPGTRAYTPFGNGKTALEQSGQVVVEAESYRSRTTEGTHNWLVIPDESAPAGPLVTNARGGKYVQCLPDIAGGGSPTNPPSISYDIVVNTPGQYRLYLRWDGNATNSTTQGQSDSIFVDVAQFKDGAGGVPAWMLDLGFVPTSLAVLFDGQPFSVFELWPALEPGEAVSLGALVDASANFYGIAFADVDLANIPEPAALTLVALGAAALLLRRRRLARSA
ncbi:MAG: LamG domain-containing protein [Planctomycetes bacterium]|nr:LamG domain-containing protein [Planctomycetota bacterium]